MTIHLATDHAGYEYKQAVKRWLRSEGFIISDHGATSIDPEDDFPDFISEAAKAVSEAALAGGSEARGIIFGGSGQGEAILANRYPGVRAAVFYGGAQEIPVLSRQHNDSNVLSIGARFVSVDEAKQVIWDWLHAPTLPDEKYHRRNEKIEQHTKYLYKDNDA